MEYRIMHTWDQMAPRAYIRLWYCLPHKQPPHANILENHLRSALSGLDSPSSDLKARIYLLTSPPGHLALCTREDDEIPIKVFDQRNSFGWTYAELRSQGFPAKAFAGHSFELPYRLVEGGEGIPVFEIHVRLIAGGLLLGFYGHHSVFDASRMNMIIQHLAKLTIEPAKQLDVQVFVRSFAPSPEVKSDEARLQSDLALDANKLISRCPEYQLFDFPAGPTQFRVSGAGATAADIENTGRIFVIHDQVVRDLQKKLAYTPSNDSREHYPSIFTCLASITWAHVTKARLASSSSTTQPSSTDEVRLMISVDYLLRTSGGAGNPSAGNSIVLPIASINKSTVLAACNSNDETAYSALAAIAHAIEKAINSVNNDFVALRNALFCKIPDPRFLGLDFDLNDPRDFYLNTWRRFGTQTRWGLPGLNSDEGMVPDAIRRAQPGFGNGSGLILPATDSTQYEVIITLDIEAMAALCKDPSWKHWVRQTVS
ncbi:anthranilate n-hydroxycinnamoyl benzoyltransferase [Fusarium beomiforme]|uniref:Anthranilate n-hydroxycinnamoyl benzoyltransferase n=1 Tax=Fusarium beomiforme TaxID=44412 RepID=A0A9P5E0H7_9HYPO|nr:anthranilate n-hydroxycinnamoyl benzoyltransferase [Fusarium beomiforme]